MNLRLPISDTFARLAGAVVLGNGLSALLGIAALRLYTELAPPEIYGMANLILGSLTLASQCIIQPVAATQIRYHTQAVGEGRAEAFTAEALAITLIGTAMLGAASAAVLAFYLWGKISYVFATAAAASIWPVLSGLRSIFMGRLHAEQLMRVYMGLRLVESAVAIVVTCLLLFAFSPNPAAFVLGQCAGISVVVCYFGVTTARPLSGMAALRAARAEFWPKLVVYGTPFIPLAILYWLAALADRYVLASLLGAAAAGKYFAAFIISAAGFGILSAVMSDLYRPKLFAAENACDRAGANRIFLAWICSYAAMSLCILIGIAVLGDWLVWLTISSAYRDGALLLLVWISVGFAINGITTALENRLLSYGHSQKLIVPVAIGALSNVGLSYVLICTNGMIGAAQASCLSFTAQLIGTFLVVRRAAAARPVVFAARTA